MIIRDELIGQNYDIKVEVNTFAIRKFTGYDKKSAEPIWTAFSWHTSFESAVKKVVSIRMSESNITVDLKEFIAEYQKLTEQITKLFL